MRPILYLASHWIRSFLHISVSYHLAVRIGLVFSLRIFVIFRAVPRSPVH